MSWSCLQLAVARALVRTVGRSSEGIRLCVEHGLTSGKAVDYIYRNQPSGRWLVGPRIDRWFLAHPGWEGVRIRRRHLERRRELLAEHIKEARAEYARGEVSRGTADELMKDLTE